MDPEVVLKKILRKLGSLPAFCKWVRKVNLIPVYPVAGIPLVEEVRPAPK